MRALVLCVLALSLAACVAGGLKPSVWTYPPGYLEGFPLDSVTEAQLFRDVGPPDQEITMTGMRGYVYRLGQHTQARSYTYLMRDGVVYDVVYHENGPYNGRTAREAQRK